MKYSLKFRRKKNGLYLLSVVFCLLLSSAHASVYYVALDGKDDAAGTLNQPFATLQKGHDVAVAGDTVYIRGGTYKISAKNAKENCGVLITKSGESEDKRIYFWAYAKEIPVFDFSDLALSSSATGAGIRINGSKWLYFKGLEICNVPQPGSGANNGIWANPCSNTIFELMNFHHNQGPGLSIAYGTGGNLILNCDSHDNYDPKSASGAGQDGDGFGCHYQSSGPSTIYKGCRSWWNSDDGYDLFKQEVAVIMNHCWAYANGTINSGAGTPGAGNGSGFKMGHTYNGARHTIKNCVAWKNRAQGFYANHSDCGSDWFNNTAYSNGSAFDMRSDSDLSGAKVHKLRNNVAYPSITKIVNPGASDMQNNTWDLGITVTTSDFLSVSDTGWMGPRGEGGSLPVINFLKLREGSKLIDKGVDVGLPYNGTAPDLGAYEFGPATGIVNSPAISAHKSVAILGNGNAVQGVNYFDPLGRALIADPRYHPFIPVIYYAPRSSRPIVATSMIQMK